MAKLTRKDIVIYITKIRLNFENAYPTRSDAEYDLLVESWYDVLAEYQKEIIDIAINNVLKKAKFAPRLGDVSEEIEKILSAQEKSPEELWAELTAVLGRVYDISRYLAYPQHIQWANTRLQAVYDGLDEQIKLYIVNISSLINLSEMAQDALNYERVRFLKQLPELKAKAQDRKNAASFMHLLSGFKDKKQIENKKK